MKSSSPLFPRRSFLGTLGVASVGACLPSFGVDAPIPPKAGVRPITGKQPGFYRFKIGDFEACALIDGTMVIPIEKLPGEFKQHQSEVIADLEQVFENSSAIELPFNSLLVRTQSDLVLIDTGAGSLWNRGGSHLSSNLEAAGVKPEEITAVMITHADFDHFGGLIDAATGKPVFNNARHFISREEFAFVTNTPDPSLAKLPATLKPGANKNAAKYIGALSDRWVFTADKDRPIDGFEIVELRGHHPGHQGILISSGKERLLHIGDVFHHYVLSVAHPDWCFSSDMVPEEAIASREKVLEQAATERLRLFGSHLPFPGLGHVRLRDKRFEFVPEAWRSV